MTFNFILVDDKKVFLDIIASSVKKVMDEFKYSCEIYHHLDYNNEFYNHLYMHMKNKIYILDIETPSNNGIEVAKMIRKIDKESIIIFVSAYEEEYLRAIIKSDTSFYCSLSKDNLAFEIWTKVYALIQDIKPKIISVISYGQLYQIIENEILYVKHENRKTFIVSEKNIFETNKSLAEIYDLLSKEFVYSHKSCIINMFEVLDYSLITKEIKFKNGLKTDLISRKYIKNLDNFYKGTN